MINIIKEYEYTLFVIKLIIYLSKLYFVIYLIQFMHVFIYLEMQFVENYGRPISTTDLDRKLFFYKRGCVMRSGPSA